MKQINIMVNGLPGNVSSMIVKHFEKDERFLLVPYSLTGPDTECKTYTGATTEVSLIKPDEKEAVIEKIKTAYPGFISVDYTHPSAADKNVHFYCTHSLPFVIGTTGGDRKSMKRKVESSDIPAVIAPNMAKQIVGLQAMMEYASETFPGLFKGYQMHVKESHQSWKADTSGTAKAMISYFNKLGIEFSEDEIQKERNPEIQKNQWGIEEKYLDGHGWHTYTLNSENNTAKFEITHNINGRDIYAEGTKDAVIYLSQKITEGFKGKVFTMIDVLKQS